ncbi:MAG: hypothetical protein D6796_02100 [Caldilineae bacterium]|nr:MAG: hypothetical protein D6796_02100 [Caldilineae bacterium]
MVKVDRTAFSVASLFDEPDEKAYWLSKTPYERLQALELMRQVVYGYTPASARLQRVLAVASFPPG